MISFGTDGWRAVIGDGFTFASVVRFGEVLAQLIHERGWPDRGIVIGYDCRFMSEDYARLLSLSCSRSGIRTILCRAACPTPAVALAARTLGTALAAIVTASHNPYRYNGIKLRDGTGAPAGEDLTMPLEEMLADGGCRLRGLPDPASSMEGGITPGVPVQLLDPFPGYHSHVGGLVDLRAIASRGGAVIHDAMHGSAAGWLGHLVPGIVTIREARDPLFGGTPPEPVLAHLSGLHQLVLASRVPVIGLATDGDGDRLAAIAEDGSYVDPHHLLALLYMHLVEVRGLRGPAVRTVTTSSLVDRLAHGYGFDVKVTPVGFKHVAPWLRAGYPTSPDCSSASAMPVIGGEESGGVGFAFHLPERDGIFAALMLLEHLAVLGITLVEAVARLREKAGRVWLGRSDIRVPTEVADAIERDCAVPEQLSGETVAGWERLDGLKLRFADGAWLHVRASHTEPVLRLYAEAGSPQRLQALLQAGKALVTEAGSSPLGAQTPGPV